VNVEPFRIAVSEAALAGLRDRPARTRLAEEIPDSGWTYRIHFAYMREVEVPAGSAVFPGERVKPLRRWAERSYNEKRWIRMSSAGHLAAMEEPRAFVDEVRAFFRPLRQA
jgi:pimeloyl-ACP methyl ester carboxylesterase